MTWQCCHDQVAVFYFIPAVVFLIFLFSSYDTEVQRMHGLAWCSCFKVKRCETTWIYATSSYQLCQATLLPLSKFFEATWNLDSFPTSGWKFQQHITCLQNQAKLPCGWDNSLMPLLSHWHTFLKHVLFLWCRMISKPHGLCWIGWMSQLVWLRDDERKVKSEQWWKVSLSQRVSLMFDCLPISQD